MSRTEQIYEQLAERNEALTLAKGKLSHAIQSLARDPNDAQQMDAATQAKATINSLTPEIDSLISALDAAQAYDTSDAAKAKRAQRAETLASLKREAAKLAAAGRAVDQAASELVKAATAHAALRNSVANLYAEHLLLLPITNERRMNICALANQELSDESGGFGHALGVAMMDLASAAELSCRNIVTFGQWVSYPPAVGPYSCLENAGKAIATIVMLRANDNEAQHAG
jgi:hypothetical protein